MAYRVDKGRAVPKRKEVLEERIYVEQVRSLFATPQSPLIMSACFALSAVVMTLQTESVVLLVLSIAGLAASGVRVGVVFRHRHETLSASLGAARARVLEGRFSITYLVFAICLGGFGGFVFQHDVTELHMLTICLLVGYCAGAAAGTGLRPRIALSSMIVAMTPALVAAALRGDMIYMALAVVASALLAGGCHSVLVRHLSTTAEIGQRITFASLARRDVLTQLPNRLALREWFAEHFTFATTTQSIAVHYLDLDGFKPVNDRFGHPIGDALLQCVAKRLTGALRPGDFLARLGGDEFAVVQLGLAQPEESELVAQRLVSALKAPFLLSGHSVAISTCVGSATTNDQGADLEQLLSRADQVLYAAKKRGRGSVVRCAAA